MKLPSTALSSVPSQTATVRAFVLATIVVIMVGESSFLGFLLLSAPDQLHRAAGPMSMILVALLGWFLVFRDQVRPAMYAIGFGVWASITFVLVLNGGVRAPLSYAYPLVIVMAGWLISAKVAIVISGMTSAVVVGLILVENAGLLPKKELAPAVLFGNTLIFVCILAAALISLLVRAYQRQLAASDAMTKRFQTAFRSSPAAFSIATVDGGRVLELNNVFERDFGWSREELLSKPTLEVGLWPSPQHRKTWAEALTKLGRLVEYETVWVHKSGERRNVSISAEIIDLDGVPCILAYTTDITERRRADEQIRSLAFYDPLTQLANRRMLQDRLQVAMSAHIRHNTLGALLFIDLDNFKTLNDSLGHDKGDELLRQVAARLTQNVRDGDTVARLGGDEFVVMLEDLSNISEAALDQSMKTAEKIRAALSLEYRFGQHTRYITPSIGITLLGCEAELVEEPLRRADLAMYQAKAAGRNTICVFDPQMLITAASRADLEQYLREAIAGQDFVAHYQPQVGADGLTMGAELLLRWQHPQRGWVSPGEFIPVAEETTLILTLGQWVIDTACVQLAKWRQIPEFSHLTLSVNVSARQFHQPDFASQVLATIERHDVPGSHLILELTESVLVANVGDVIAKMQVLQTSGIRFSLDDFGTGYSSLGYLKRLPLYELKIDQSFVRDILVDPNDAAIARMVIVLAETLGLRVVAEGVETRQQKEALLAQGCRAYQGYLFAPPMPLSDFERFIDRTVHDMAAVA